MTSEVLTNAMTYMCMSTKIIVNRQHAPSLRIVCFKRTHDQQYRTTVEVLDFLD